MGEPYDSPLTPVGHYRDPSPRISPSRITAPEKDCYGNEREALGDYERFYNNVLCSDVSLLVGDEM